MIAVPGRSIRSSRSLGQAFGRAWSELHPIGREEATGGYYRLSWTAEDAALRAWFWSAATERGMTVEVDRNGNEWAWWGGPAAGAVVTGSHLDSVPGGGAYDGPLGVVAGFLAVDDLRQRAVVPNRPIAVVHFADEEGGRFGVPCVGSRLLTGALDPEQARGRRDRDGVTMAEAMGAAGVRPERIGRDDQALSRIAAVVELHIEQGRGLIDAGRPVGVASRIWPHGRWSLVFSGAADHAGTTRLADRRDPLLPFAATALAARTAAERAGGLATIGQVHVQPGASNGIASRVAAWLDARAPDEPVVRQLVSDVAEAAEAAGREHAVAVTVSGESYTRAVEFDATLRERLVAALRPGFGSVPILATGAGHDAGVLAVAAPTAMLFVRNPTGVSHSPAEQADAEDCLAGVRALSAALEELAC